MGKPPAYYRTCSRPPFRICNIPYYGCNYLDVPRPRDEIHYSPRLAEITYWFLTLGTVDRFICEITSSYINSRILDWLIVLSSASQVLAGLLFIYNVWSRVRPVRKQTRFINELCDGDNFLEQVF